MQDAVVTTVGADNADGQFAQLLDRAEHGEEIVLTRHGRAVARLVPVEPVHDKVAAERAVQELLTLGRKLAQEGRGQFTMDEILAARHEGHRY